MFRAAELLCEREGAAGIVTGESLGQKASQTLPNLGATSTGIKFPIIRPLMGLDKIEIERLSKKLGLWHEVHAGCCYATPKHPRTRGDFAIADSMLERLNVDELISKGVENLLDIRTFDEDFEGYLEKIA
jgi:thiamine biosynthesis protein ThiI